MRIAHLARPAGRIILGLALVFTGLSHLSWARIEFQAQVPEWLPMNPDMVVILSGIVEISLGVALIFFWRHRVSIGWATAAFFVLVFPGNISQYVHHRNAFMLGSDHARMIRLFFQPVLVAWALWSTGAWRRSGESQQ
jgi:uncharacterized membrane protein